MLQRIEREPSGALGRIVPQLIGHEAVAEFMERYAYERRNYTENNTQQIGKVKTVPY